MSVPSKNQGVRRKGGEPHAGKKKGISPASSSSRRQPAEETSQKRRRKKKTRIGKRTHLKTSKTRCLGVVRKSENGASQKEKLVQRERSIGTGGGKERALKGLCETRISVSVLRERRKKFAKKLRNRAIKKREEHRAT